MSCLTTILLSSLSLIFVLWSNYDLQLIKGSRNAGLSHLQKE